MSVRIHEKFTLPCACLVFGLIGSSLGSKPNLRSSKSQGFGLSVILILLYYVLSFVSSSLGVKGTLTPFLSAWLPVFISLYIGFFKINYKNFILFLLIFIFIFDYKSAIIPGSILYLLHMIYQKII